MALGDSEVTICNSALNKLGASTILSLDDNTREAKLCKRQYPLVRNRLLRSHPWNFAIARVELAETTGDPLFEFTNSFQLPTDCLRVLGIDNNDIGDIKFKIEGRLLLVNTTSVKIKYITNNITPSNFDSNFVEILAYDLAAEIAYPLVQSVSLAGQMKALAQEELRSTRLYDAQEGSQDELEAEEWLVSRF